MKFIVHRDRKENMKLKRIEDNGCASSLLMLVVKFNSSFMSNEMEKFDHLCKWDIGVRR